VLELKQTLPDLKKTAAVAAASVAHPIAQNATRVGHPQVEIAAQADDDADEKQPRKKRGAGSGAKRKRGGE
jgi:hypothetical protein